MRGTGLLFVLASLASAAPDAAAFKPRGAVSDFARVVDSVSRRQLERYCGEFKQKTGVEIALVTLVSLEGEPPGQFASKLFREWMREGGQNREGVLLLVAAAERRIHLESSPVLEAAFQEEATGALLDEMSPALRDNHYGDALILGASSIGARVLVARGISGGPRPPAPARNRLSSGFPWIILLAFPCLVFAFTVILKRRIMAVVPQSRMVPRSLASWIGARPPGRTASGRGGFGGVDSMGARGGFGGAAGSFQLGRSSLW